MIQCIVGFSIIHDISYDTENLNGSTNTFDKNVLVYGFTQSSSYFLHDKIVFKVCKYTFQLCIVIHYKKHC